MKRKTNKSNLEVIGYLMEKDYLVVTNPCKIQLELLEKQIKENKRNPPKKNETKFIGVISLKLPFRLNNKRRKKWTKKHYI